jgi:hypothetical protein
MGVEKLLAYLTLVAGSYQLAPQHQLPAVRPASAPHRVVKEVEARFLTLPASYDPFDHYRAAEYLVRQGTDFVPPGLDHALGCFERLYRDLNELL